MIDSLSENFVFDQDLSVDDVFVQLSAASGWDDAKIGGFLPQLRGHGANGVNKLRIRQSSMESEIYIWGFAAGVESRSREDATYLLHLDFDPDRDEGFRVSFASAPAPSTTA